MQYFSLDKYICKVKLKIIYKGFDISSEINDLAVNFSGYIFESRCEFILFIERMTDHFTFEMLTLNCCAILG